MISRKHLLPAICIILAPVLSSAQNVGIGITSPTEILQVDSTVKIGKNNSIPTGSSRKNLLKFGDGNYVTIGEDVVDDKLYIRSGDLVMIKSSGSLGNGYVGINTETPTAQLDLNGSLRIRSGAGDGKVLTSDASGNATWQTSGVREHTILIGPSAMMGRDNVFLTRLLGNGGAYYSAAVNGGLVYAPLVLPVGATITAVTFYFIDNSSNNYSFSIEREWAAASGFNSDVITVNSAGASGTIQSLSQTLATPHVVTAGSTYYVSMYGNFTGNFNDASFKSVLIDYTY